MTPNVALIGCGALGSHLIYAARNLDVAWRLIDGDRVEVKNTTSQFHPRQGVGQNKANQLAASLRQLFGVTAHPYPHMLGEHNAGALLDGSALLIDATDNAPARRLAARWARRHHVPCMHLGIAAEGLYGRVAWTTEARQFEPDEAPAGVATCEDGAFLPRIVLLAAAGAEALSVWLRAGEHQEWSVGPRWARVEG